jgi:hypothetical protein
MGELYLHSPVRLHDMLLDYEQRQLRVGAAECATVGEASTDTIGSHSNVFYAEMSVGLDRSTPAVV